MDPAARRRFVILFPTILAVAAVSAVVMGYTLAIGGAPPVCRPAGTLLPPVRP